MIGMQTLDLQRSDHREPDRAAADHERHLAALHPRLLDRMHADRQRFGQRGVLRQQAVRHFQQQRFAEQHPLGIAADILVGIADALRPRRRQQRRQRTDARAGLEPLLRARPVIDDLAAELMAEHDIARRVHRLAAGDACSDCGETMRVLARMQIGAADAAGERFDQHLLRTGHRLGHGIDDNLALPEDRSAHGVPPSKAARLSWMEAGARAILDHILNYGRRRRQRLLVRDLARSRRPPTAIASAARARDARCRGRLRR